MRAAFKVLRLALVAATAVAALQVGLATDWGPPAWVTAHLACWTSLILLKGLRGLTASDWRHAAWGAASLLGFMRFLDSDPGFQGWEDVYYFCGREHQYCTSAFTWNARGWRKALAIWNFVLSSALALQKLAVTVGLGGLLPGEEVVTRESFISIGWRLIPYWLNNWEQQWGAECSSMIFELPHFALELLVVLPCVQIVCSRLRILAQPHVVLQQHHDQRRRQAQQQPPAGPAGAVPEAPAAGAEAVQEQAQAQGELHGQGQAVQPLQQVHQERDQLDGGQLQGPQQQLELEPGEQEDEEGDQSLAPNIMRCCWEPAPRQRRLLPRLRANVRPMAVVAGIAAVALFNALVMPVMLERQVSISSRSRLILDLAPELAFVARAGREAEQQMWQWRMQQWAQQYNASSLTGSGSSAGGNGSSSSSIHADGGSSKQGAGAHAGSAAAAAALQDALERSSNSSRRDAKLAVWSTLWLPLLPDHWLRAMLAADAHAVQGLNSTILSALQYREVPGESDVLARQLYAAARNKTALAAARQALLAMHQQESPLHRLAHQQQGGAGGGRAVAGGAAAEGAGGAGGDAETVQLLLMAALQAGIDASAAPLQLKASEAAVQAAAAAAGRGSLEAGPQSAGYVADRLDAQQLQSPVLWLRQLQSHYMRRLQQEAARRKARRSSTSSSSAINSNNSASNMGDSSSSSSSSSKDAQPVQPRQQEAEGRGKGEAQQAGRQLDGQGQGREGPAQWTEPPPPHPRLSALYRGLHKHALELKRMRDPSHDSIIALVELSLAIMRLSCERFFSLVAVYVGYLLFRDPPPAARRLITGVAGMSTTFQRLVLYLFPAICWTHGAGFVFSFFVSIVFWTAPLLRLVAACRGAATSLRPRSWHPATAEEVERMGGQCAICWGDLSPSAAEAAAAAAAAAVPSVAAGSEGQGQEAAAAEAVPETQQQQQQQQQHAAVAAALRRWAAEGTAAEHPTSGAAAAGAGAAAPAAPGAAAIATGPAGGAARPPYAERAMGLACGHAYHQGCLAEWLRQCYTSGRGATCPMCQASIPLRVTYRLPWRQDQQQQQQQQGGAAEGQGAAGAGANGGGGLLPLLQGAPGMPGLALLVQQLQEDFQNRFERGFGEDAGGVMPPPPPVLAAPDAPAAGAAAAQDAVPARAAAAANGMGDAAAAAQDAVPARAAAAANGVGGAAAANGVGGAAAAGNGGRLDEAAFEQLFIPPPVAAARQAGQPGAQQAQQQEAQAVDQQQAQQQEVQAVDQQRRQPRQGSVLRRVLRRLRPRRQGAPAAAAAGN